jgi:hypothetical protein
MALLLVMSLKAPGRNVPEPTKGTSLSSQFLIHLTNNFLRNLHLFCRTPYCNTVHVTIVHSRAASGRAQRASARNQIGISSTVDPSVNLESGSTSTLQPILVDSDSCTMVIDDDLSLSRSNSSLNLQDPPQASSSGRARRKDKGKEKEAETPPIRVKEEPKIISLHTPEPVPNLVRRLRSMASKRYLRPCLIS